MWHCFKLSRFFFFFFFFFLSRRNSCKGVTVIHRASCTYVCSVLEHRKKTPKIVVSVEMLFQVILSFAVFSLFIGNAFDTFVYIAVSTRTIFLAWLGVDPYLCSQFIECVS